jgi:hypothetical protein
MGGTNSVFGIFDAEPKIDITNNNHLKITKL